MTMFNKIKAEEGAVVNKNPSKRRARDLQSNIDWMVEQDATEHKERLRTLMEVTAFLENSFGANPKAYDRNYTNSHWSIDEPFMNDLLTKMDPEYDKVYYDYLDKYDKINRDRSNLRELLESNDDKAGVLSARIKYAVSPDPLPDNNDLDAVVDYWYKNYNSNKDFTEKDIDKKRVELKKWWSSRGQETSDSPEQKEFKRIKTKENSGYYYNVGDQAPLKFID